jgi:hypothetical protein
MSNYNPTAQWMYDAMQANVYEEFLVEYAMQVLGMDSVQLANWRSGNAYPEIGQALAQQRNWMLPNGKQFTSMWLAAAGLVPAPAVDTSAADESMALANAGANFLIATKPLRTNKLATNVDPQTPAEMAKKS